MKVKWRRYAKSWYVRRRRNCLPSYRLVNKFSLCLYFPHDFAFKQFPIACICTFFLPFVPFVEIFAAAANKVINQIENVSCCLCARECDCTQEIDDAFKFKSIQHLVPVLCVVAWTYTIWISFAMLIVCTILTQLGILS